MVSVDPGTNIGDLIYWDGSAWVILEPGAADQLLFTQGVGAAPEWRGVELEEGYYEGWVKIWDLQIPGFVDVSYEALDFTIDDENDLIYVFWRSTGWKNRFGIFNISNFSTVFLTPDSSDYNRGHMDLLYHTKSGIHFGSAMLYYGGTSQSLKTYFLIGRTDCEICEVWNKGNKLQVFDVKADCSYFGELFSGAISPTGKYVAFFVVDYSSSPYVTYIPIYKGIVSALPGTSTGVTETKISDSTKSWSTDEWIGKWVKASSGNGKGYIAQITSNDSTSVTCTGATFSSWGMVGGDDYLIMEEET